MPERVKITKESRIALLEPSPTSEGSLDRGLIGDVYGGFNLPSRAIDGLKPVAQQRGYKNVVCINPRYNRRPGRLAEDDVATLAETDILGVSTITRTIPQARRITALYRKLRPDGWVLAGGVHATALPEETLQWADIVALGEGEHVFPEVLDALADSGSVKGVKGTVRKENGEIVREKERPLLTEAELEQIPWPDFDQGYRKGRSVSVVIGSRGCPRGCIYCGVTSFYGEMYRSIGIDPILARVEKLLSEKEGERVFYADDNLAGKPRKAEALLDAMIDRGLNSRKYLAQLRAEIGLRKGFPEKLRKAGIDRVAVGAESINEAVLAAINKQSTAKTTIEGIRALREAGVKVHVMLMLGLDGDTVEGLMDQLEWAKRDADTAQFCVPIPLPGTPFAEAMRAQGRILTNDYQYYGGQDVIIRPDFISPYDLQMLQYHMYEDFYSFKLTKDPVRNATNRVLNGSSEEWADFKLDFAMRLYAWNTLRALRNDPQTQRHLLNLKAQS